MADEQDTTPEDEQEVRIHDQDAGDGGWEPETESAEWEPEPDADS